MDELEKALVRARSQVERLQAIEAARTDPTHEHDWWVFDGSRHCFKCRRTEHEPYPTASQEQSPHG
jgi:hypothetical protein